jgi:hypothetical protein
MQFGVICLKTWGSTQCHVAFLTLEFCSCCAVVRKSTAPSFLPCQRPVFTVSCIKSNYVAGRWGLPFLLYIWVCVSCILSHTNVSMKSLCNNFEPLRWQMLILLRMVNSRRWKKQLICPFPVLSAKGVKVCHATRFVNLPHMAITVPLLQPVSEIHSNHRKYSLLVERASLSVCSHFFCPCTSWLSSNHHPRLCPPPLNFIFCTILSGITVLIGLTVPQQFTIAECNHQITLEVSFPRTVCVPHF